MQTFSSFHSNKTASLETATLHENSLFRKSMIDDYYKLMLMLIQKNHQFSYLSLFRV